MDIILRLLSNINTITVAEFTVQSNMIGWEQVVPHVGSCRVCGGHISVLLLLHHVGLLEYKAQLFVRQTTDYLISTHLEYKAR